MRILEEALTFDDVLLVPAYSEVLPREVSLASKLTRELQVNLPVGSAAMDAVTEARLAIAIARRPQHAQHLARAGLHVDAPQDGLAAARHVQPLGAQRGPRKSGGPYS